MQFFGDGIHQPSNWKRLERVGRGAHGTVFKVIKDDRHMAVKVVSADGQTNLKEMEAFYKEIKTLKCLRHDRVVRYFGECTEDNDVFLFMEYFPGGSLENHLNRNSPLECDVISEITKQILEGVVYLHDKRIIHRDIKAANILMEEHFRIKLADFGVSKMFEKLSKSATIIGTTRWMAPEMFNCSEYSYEVDIWAVGCTVIQMLTGSYPFPDKEEQQVTFHLIRQDLSPLYSLTNIHSREILEFLNSTFENDPQNRPKAKNLLEESPFINEGRFARKMIAYKDLRQTLTETWVSTSNMVHNGSNDFQDFPVTYIINPSECSDDINMDYVDIYSDSSSVCRLIPLNSSEPSNDTCSISSDGPVHSNIENSEYDDFDRYCFVENLHIGEAQLLLAKVPWFHGVMPRKEIMRICTNQGDFLVRESKNRQTKETQFVLSVFWERLCHLIILFTPGEGWYLQGKTYHTIPELVTDLVRSSACVTHESSAILRKPILREWELVNCDIVPSHKIVKGYFGEVLKGMYKKTRDVTMHTCRENNTDDELIEFLRMARLLKQFIHPNIVTYIGVAAQEHPIMIVTEFMPNGTLLSLLKTHGKQQTIRQLGQMCVDVAHAMEYLEEKKIIHRDLAAKNCLVAENNMVKLSEFRLSREGIEYTDINSNGISINWAAPESLKFGKYTSLSDVWSFGVLVWEVFSIGQTPYGSETKQDIIDRIEMGYHLKSPPGTPQQIYKFMLNCWNYDEDSRPRFKTIHQFLKDNI